MKRQVTNSASKEMKPDEKFMLKQNGQAVRDFKLISRSFNNACFISRKTGAKLNIYY